MVNFFVKTSDISPQCHSAQLGAFLGFSSNFTHEKTQELASTILITDK